MKFKSNIAMQDGTHPVNSVLPIDWQEVTQENLNDTAARIKNREDEIKALTDDDVVSFNVDAVNDIDSPTKSASFSVQNMTVGELKQYFNMIQNALASVSTPPTTEETPVGGGAVADGGEAKESDKQQ